MKNLASKPSFRSLAYTVRLSKAGLLAGLPCAIAGQKPDLIRVAEPPGSFSLDLRPLTHEHPRHTARIRAVLDFLAISFAGVLGIGGEGAGA